MLQPAFLPVPAQDPIQGQNANLFPVSQTEVSQDLTRRQDDNLIPDKRQNITIPLDNQSDLIQGENAFFLPASQTAAAPDSAGIAILLDNYIGVSQDPTRGQDANHLPTNHSEGLQDPASGQELIKLPICHSSRYPKQIPHVGKILVIIH